MATRGTRPAEDAPRGTVRHVPVLLPQVLQALAPAAGDSPTLTPPSAPAATARRSCAAAPGARVLGIDRDPDRDCRRRRARRTHPGPPDARRRPLRRSRSHRARGGLRACRRRRARHRRLLDAARRSRARLLLPGRRPARHAHVGHRPERRPSAADVVNTAEEAHLADILFHLGEERSARGIARAIVARRRQQPFARTSELAEPRRARARAREDRRPACRHAHVPGAAHLRQRRAGRAGGAASPRPSACWRPAGGSSSSPSTRSRTGWSSSSSSGARSRSRTGSRHLPPQAGARPPPSFRFVNHRPLSPTDKEIAANPRARSAKLQVGRAHRCPGLGRGRWRSCRPAPRRVRRCESRAPCSVRSARSIWVLMLATLASAVALYAIKNDTRRLEVRVHAQERALERAENDVAVLTAERAHLARPERLEPLARLIGLVAHRRRPIPAPRHRRAPRPSAPKRAIDTREVEDREGGMAAPAASPMPHAQPLTPPPRRGRGIARHSLGDPHRSRPSAATR